jgi:esterase/lipase superfamily enzyme
MQREITSWFSPSLNKEMPIAVYGNYGFALLLIPTAAADYLEYERFQMMDALAPFIDGGKMKVFSIDSINKESWLNNEMLPAHKAIRQNDLIVMCTMKSCLSYVTVPVTTPLSIPVAHHLALCMP